MIPTVYLFALEPAPYDIQIEFLLFKLKEIVQNDLVEKEENQSTSYRQLGLPEERSYISLL